MKHLHARLSLALLPLVSACSVLPAYQAPTPAVASQWQAALPHGGNSGQMRNWWSQFNDPVLLALQDAAEKDNPSLDKAAAAIREARANIVSSEAANWPTVNGSATATRAKAQGLQGAQVTTTRALAADASWEIDLFGAVRYATDSATAKAESKLSDWHAARVSLAAEVASNYINYQACQQQVTAYQAELASQSETARITDILVKAGFNPPADANLAHASVASAAASVTAQQESCDLTVKSLVTLTGLQETALRSKLGTSTAAISQPAGFEVADIPAAKVSQRPDVMSAERTLAAAYADIGSAEADRYPRLSLLGSIAATAASGATLTSWSFGPSLSMPLFDAGKRKAAANAARARYDQALASYKSAVRSAIEETEKALVSLNSATQRQQNAKTAAENYRAYLNASEILWKSGGMSLLDLESARRTAITADLNLISLKRDQVNQWIALYKSLGGDWQAVTAQVNTSESTLEAKQQ